MKKTILTIASLVFVGAASANPFLEDQHDRYSGMSDNSSAPTASQPGTGDSYGGNVFEQTHLAGVGQGSGRIPMGSGDAYGSPIPNVESGDLTW
jgi:hypothetical protein